MNNLISLYKDIKTFADGHRMVNQFLLVGSEDDINQREFDYRTLVMIPMEANLSRDLLTSLFILFSITLMLDLSK